MTSLWQRWQHRRERLALARRAIPDDLWKRTLVRFPFLQRRDPADAVELRRLTSLFLDRKEFNAAGGLVLSDAMVVAVAAQAVLPVLRLGLARYDGFVGIVMHPDAVVARREVADEDGVVHSYDETLSGEAMVGGPVMLSWRDVRSAGRSTAFNGGAAYNVVIHEFAHVLDLATGTADGMPLLPREIDAAEWRQTLQAEFERFVLRVEGNGFHPTGAGDPSGDHDGDGDSDRTSDGDGDVDVDVDTALDPYGATSPDEFFAVASEAFFVKPTPMRAEHPSLYALFRRFYGQDPAVDTPVRTAKK